MNNEADVIKEFEKSPLGSKKLLAFLMTGFFWKVIILVTVLKYGLGIGVFGTVVVCLMIVTEGAISIGYIIGQAGLDKYVRLARIAAGIAPNSPAPPAPAPSVSGSENSEDEKKEETF